MMQPPAMPPKMRLGELLVTAGVVSPSQLESALADQKKWGGRLGKIIVDLGFLDEETMVLALSRQLRIPSIDLNTTTLAPDVTQFLSVDLCERYGVVPIWGDEQRRLVKIATSDPTNRDSLAEISRWSGYKVEPVVASITGIEQAIRRLYYGEEPKQPAPQPRSATPVATPSAPNTQVNQGGFIAGRTLDPALAETLARMERMLTGEVRALRTLVEMLIDKGLIDRDEYVRRVRGR